MHPNRVARPIIEAALRGDLITYTELGIALGRAPEALPGRGWGKALVELEQWCTRSGLPPLSLMVVEKGRSRPGDTGTYRGRRYGDMTDEEIKTLQRQVFAYDWLQHAAVFGLDRQD